MSKTLQDIAAEKGFEQTAAATTTDTTEGETSSTEGNNSTPVTTPVDTSTASEPPKQIHPSEIFGDDYKEKDWEAVKTDHAARVKRMAELEEEANTLRNARPSYANEDVQGYDAWIRNGGTANYGLYQKVKNVNENLTDIDAIITQKIIESPSYAGFEQQLKDELLSQFQIEATDENGLTQAQVDFNKAKLAERGIKAREFLKSQQDKLQVPQSPMVDTEKQLASRVEKWSPAIKKMVSDFKNFPIPHLVKEGDKEIVKSLTEYQVPDHVKANYEESFIKFYSQNADLSPEAMEHAVARFKTNFIADNLPYLITHALDHHAAQLNAEWEKKVGGGMSPKDPGTSRSKDDTYQQNREKMRNF